MRCYFWELVAPCQVIIPRYVGVADGCSMHITTAGWTHYRCYIMWVTHNWIRYAWIWCAAHKLVAPCRFFNNGYISLKLLTAHENSRLDSWPVLHRVSDLWVKYGIRACVAQHIELVALCRIIIHCHVCLAYSRTLHMRTASRIHDQYYIVSMIHDLGKVWVNVMHSPKRLLHLAGL